MGDVDCVASQIRVLMDCANKTSALRSMMSVHNAQPVFAVRTPPVAAPVDGDTDTDNTLRVTVAVVLGVLGSLPCGSAWLRGDRSSGVRWVVVIHIVGSSIVTISLALAAVVLIYRHRKRRAYINVDDVRPARSETL